MASRAVENAAQSALFAERNNTRELTANKEKREILLGIVLLKFRYPIIYSPLEFLSDN
jgi:hypothetical protein